MKAVMVLVEGEADVGLVRRCLGHHHGAQWINKRPINLPTPFGAPPGGQPSESLVLAWQARIPPAAQNLREAGRGGQDPTFDSVLRISDPGGDIYYVIVLLGGDERFASAGVNLIDRLEIAASFSGMDVKQCAIACFFDADAPSHYPSVGPVAPQADCVALREQWLHDALKPSQLKLTASPRHSCWEQGGAMPVGLYVFHDPHTKQGTVEDILEPIVRQYHPTRLTDADAYLQKQREVDQAKARLTDADAYMQVHPPTACTRPVDQAKARLTIALQPTRPGFSLATWTQGGGNPADKPLPDAAFDGPECQAIADFLTAVPW